MKVVLSAHFDLARPVMFMKLEAGCLNGLVDNFAGVFAAYQANRKLDVPVYLTNYEELEYDGAIDVAQKLDRENTIVIVVDTIKQTDLPKEKIASITNVYNLDIAPLKQSFSDKIHFIDGFFEQTEDETWIYGNRFGFRTFYFGFPIPKDYHATDNSVPLGNVDKVSELLTDLAKFLQNT